MNVRENHASGELASHRGVLDARAGAGAPGVGSIGPPPAAALRQSVRAGRERTAAPAPARRELVGLQRRRRQLVSGQRLRHSRLDAADPARVYGRHDRHAVRAAAAAPDPDVQRARLGPLLPGSPADRDHALRRRHDARLVALADVAAADVERRQLLAVLSGRAHAERRPVDAGRAAADRRHRRVQAARDAVPRRLSA